MRLLDIDDPRLMMRTGESVYTELALADQDGRCAPGGDQPASDPAGTPHLRRRRPGRHRPSARKAPGAPLTIPGAAGTAPRRVCAHARRHVHGTGDDNDDFSGVLRDPRHRQHGGGLRREPPTLLGSRRPARSLCSKGPTTPSACARCSSGGTSTCATCTSTATGPATSTTPRCSSRTGPPTPPPRTTRSSTWCCCPCGPSPKGRRRGLRWAWIFFVMSLFTSLAFSVAFFLAFMERQLRYNRSLTPSSTA